MKLSRFIEKNPLEVLLAVLLIIFILSPIQPPNSIANAIDSTLGIVITSFLIVYLFVYSHTLLAILFVIAIFELVRRSSTRVSHKPAVVTYTALQPAMPTPSVSVSASIPVEDNMPENEEPVGKNELQTNKEQERRDLDSNMLKSAGQGMAINSVAGIARQGVVNSPVKRDYGSDFVDYEMSQALRDREMMQMNTKLMEITLEEELVHSMPAPSLQSDYLDSSFKPVYDNIRQASPF